MLVFFARTSPVQLGKFKTRCVKQGNGPLNHLICCCRTNKQTFVMVENVH